MGKKRSSIEYDDDWPWSLREAAKHQPDILARDPEAGMILLGGLGAMRVGVMWFVDDGSYAKWRGYDKAPLQKYTPDPYLQMMHENVLAEARVMSIMTTSLGQSFATNSPLVDASGKVIDGDYFVVLPPAKLEKR